ncbi:MULTISPECIES: CHASE2 domain-containing protein [Oxalobacteraceae]|uniref:CHASE2 domain-containing protein n=1 Tax=Herminiimonas sp. Marseille-P9896 TaxID=2742211 RepID=UPI001589D5FC|nr:MULTISPECIES: CHASE2 domain-containing protein [Oxalobacteraceae]
MLLLAILLGYENGLGQADRFIYDNLVKATQRPAPSDVVIIAIDEFSIASLGRWPWQRRTHAELLDILTKAKAKAVGMDIIFAEPQYLSDDDALLASAIANNKRTVLPVLIERTPIGLQPTLPLPAFRQAANSLGHIHFTFEADGVVRGIYLQENLHGVSWPQFAQAVFNAAQSDGKRSVLADNIVSDDYRDIDVNSILQGDNPARIPYTGRPGHFKTISYIDVLSGKIPPSFFTDKYVLIGATAAGIASTFATPVTTDHEAMSGVEINANILSGLIEGRSIRPAARWQTILFTLLSTSLALLACRYFSPFGALGLTLFLASLISALTYGAFLEELWIPPSAAILMVVIVYPLWSWRRLEAALAYLSEEFARLNQTTPMVLRHANETVRIKNSDYLDRQIGAIRIAANRSRDMHQFVIDNLNSMPDATLVLSQTGEILMYNRIAREYFATLNLDKGQTPTLEAIFSKFDMLQDVGSNGTDWRVALLHSTPGNTAVEIETRDINKREFLIKSAPSRMADGSMLGWIVSLIDVTTLRAAERRREESLNFISHDMRVPQSSILALIQLQRNPSTAFAIPEFLNRIEKSVETTLNLADDFVHLAKAESQSYQLQDTDFSSLLAEAADDMWAFAHSKSISIVVDAQEVEDCWLNVDRSLVIRALGNLLSNAIKFSPKGSEIICSAKPLHTETGSSVVCNITDHGKGIADADRSAIFSPFLRADEQDHDGVGLGLAFVKMVVERHNGSIEVSSTVGLGSTFTITLPCVIG